MRERKEKDKVKNLHKEQLKETDSISGVLRLNKQTKNTCMNSKCKCSEEEDTRDFSQEKTILEKSTEGVISEQAIVKNLETKE